MSNRVQYMDDALIKRWAELTAKIHAAGVGEELNELLLIDRKPFKAYENLQKSAQILQKSI